MKITPRAATRMLMTNWCAIPARIASINLQAVSVLLAAYSETLKLYGLGR